MLDSNSEKQIHTLLQTALTKGEFAGANILVLKDGKEVFYHQDGFSDIASLTPISRDSIFRLYSMTKPITSVAIMILLERGLLDLYDPLSIYIPSFKNQKVIKDSKLVDPQNPISIKDLLSMTSGLLYPGKCQAGSYIDNIFKELDKRINSDDAMTTKEFASRAGKTNLAFEPGSKWAYGISADILGRVVEVVSGKTFSDFLESELFKPLGMSDTAFYVPDSKKHRLTTVYQTDNYENLIPYYGNNLGILNSMDRNPNFESGGAGLVSTIDDYSNFTTMLIQNGKFNGKEILKPRTVQFYSSQVLDSNQKTNLNTWKSLSGFNYGNLIRVMTKPELFGGLSSIGEYGWDGWLGCYMANFPIEKLTILVMMQQTDTGTSPFVRKLRNILLSRI